MCIITVFSISMLCYVVSDLDSPFSGFFRVDLSVLLHVVERLELMYKEAKHEETNLSTDTSDLERKTSPPSRHSISTRTKRDLHDAELWVSVKKKLNS